MASPQPQVLRFCPLQSCVDVTFWSELGSRKLDEYKLSEQPIGIQGFLTASRHDEVGSMLQVAAASFAADSDSSTSSSGPQGSHAVPGQLLLTNTMQALKRLDKPGTLQQAGRQVWADIASGAAEAAPQLLCRFLLLAHGDLKHFAFTYWFGFPALKPPAPFTQLAVQPLAEALPAPGLARQICAAADAWRSSSSASSSSRASSSASPPPFCLMQLDTGSSAVVATAGLSAWAQLTAAAAAAGGAGARDVVLAMFDACHLPLTPGWPLRNALLLAAVRWRVRALRVVCVRDSAAGRAAPERCFVVEVGLPQVPTGWHTATAASGGSSVPDVLGWEANAEGRLLPRTVDVSPLLSPVQLAEQAVDLNLRLMRWRAAPELDVAALAATRCLLLGAGTLGCAAARSLMAWGVRHITFVDAATVSYSNPVRQSLFTFEDCLAGGKPKAAAAAAALAAIFPSVQAAGHDLTIPMPGHPPANAQDAAAMQQAAEALAALVAAHDVVFLLTDTRESRWLPTLLAAAAGKVAITAALGFDTFLVMRHGLPPPPAAADAPPGGADACAQAGSHPFQQQQQQQQQQQHSEQQHRLGCYFCNDVVAPLNSTIDRTLDQQCTVARPGLAPIAGALAVELMAALLQHPARGRAPAPSAGGGRGAAGAAPAAASRAGAPPAAAAAAAGGALGHVPHMVRGQLSGFGQVCMAGQAFSQCTACSPAVLQQHAREGWSFLARVLQQPGCLEELTGLAELHRQAAALDLGGGSDAGSDEGGAGGGGSGSDSDADWAQL